MAMLPKEHGAYGQLFLPALTAVAMGRPSRGAVAVLVAAAAAFVAHEAVLVLAGARGPRAQRQEGSRARRWLLGLAGIGLVAGVTAWRAFPAGAHWALAVPLVAAGAAVTWGLRGRERTTGGELAAGVALAAVSFPIGIAAGLPVPAAAGCAAAFVAGGVAATLSVRAVIAHARGQASGPGRVTAVVVAMVLAAVLGILATWGIIHANGFWGGLPMTAVAIGIAWIAPRPAHLRRVGWTLIAATVTSAAVLILAP